MLLKKRISALLMLAVILPAVLIAPFHHHHRQLLQEDSNCHSCAQHQPHQGHLNPGAGTDECLICQLLGQQYVPSEGITVCFNAAVSAPSPEESPKDAASPVHNPSSPRAPPVSFCM